MTNNPENDGCINAVLLLWAGSTVAVTTVIQLSITYGTYSPPPSPFEYLIWLFSPSLPIRCIHSLSTRCCYGWFFVLEHSRSKPLTRVRGRFIFRCSISYMLSLRSSVLARTMNKQLESSIINRGNLLVEEEGREWPGNPSWKARNSLTTQDKRQLPRDNERLFVLSESGNGITVLRKFFIAGDRQDKKESVYDRPVQCGQGVSRYSLVLSVFGGSLGAPLALHSPILEPDLDLKRGRLR